jgi:hypothetical protein
LGPIPVVLDEEERAGIRHRTDSVLEWSVMGEHGQAVIELILETMKKNGMTQEQAQKSVYEMQMAGVVFKMTLLPEHLRPTS